MITPAQIVAACGQPLRKRDEGAPRASGTLASHYAPKARVRLMDGQQLQAALEVLGADAKHIAVYSRTTLRAAERAGLIARYSIVDELEQITTRYSFDDYLHNALRL